MTVPTMDGLRAFYPTSKGVTVGALPAGTSRAQARAADGRMVEGALATGRGSFELAPGTYAIEALDPDGRVLAEELTTVADHAGDRPVHGFVSSFSDDSVDDVLRWLRDLRCTVVQFYDWMSTYSAPLGPSQGWEDPSHRPVSFNALRALAGGLRVGGAVAHAYAPVYAVDLEFAAAHPDLLMYRGDGEAERLFDNIKLADPGNEDWQRHFTQSYGHAADEIGFDGFHMDTYGFPRAALDRQGRALEMTEAYRSFLAYFRAARPSDLVSLNQVNGVPSAFSLPDGPAFRYCEIWPPNDLWRHMEGLLDRSSGQSGLLGRVGPGRSPLRGTIACYPPVWEERADVPVAEEKRLDALRTVVLTEAIVTCLGASPLLYGDLCGALRDPYYPKHARLSAAEAQTVLAWHRFALRCRDLFLDAEDTSWYDIGDENGAVSVEAEPSDEPSNGGPTLVRPEPLGGSIFSRVVRSDEVVAVSVIDLTGSAHGSWREPTAAGRCRAVTTRVLVDRPDNWETAVAVLGQGQGKFSPVPSRVVAHREGLALEVRVPLESGWSVLRVTRRRKAKVGSGRSSP